MIRALFVDTRPRGGLRSVCCSIAIVVMSLPARDAAAQDDRRAFAGALVGVSTLSGDAHAVTTASEASVSLYKPENGLALNVFGGIHLAQYFSVQGNWMWNRNDVTLISSLVSPAGGGFYEQRRHSGQHAAVLDALIYFRRSDSAVRPYLGTGLSLLHFSSGDIVSSSDHGLQSPPRAISSTRLGLRSHVGIDIRLSAVTSFRYTFSETISTNPISPSLTPPAPRRLANFQNLFGFVRRF
jgi:hypothetical protein